MSRNPPKSKVYALTKKGLDWIKENMWGELPIVIETEYVGELQEAIQAAGLSVGLK